MENLASLSIIYWLANFTIVVILGRVIYYQLRSDFANITDDEEIKTSSGRSNPFSKNKEQVSNSNSTAIIYEKTIGKYLNIIAVICGMALCAIVYYLFVISFYNYLKSEQNNFLIVALTCAVSLGLGYLFVHLVIHKIKRDNDLLSIYGVPLLKMRIKGLVMLFISIFFFLLILTLIEEIDLKFNIIKASALSLVGGVCLNFLLGSRRSLLFKSKKPNISADESSQKENRLEL